MTLTVIIPVYNTSKYLKQCIHSVQNQTYSDLEILLVDDGSTDESGEIIEEYAKSDSRIRAIHQKNQGLSAARNAGITRACGEYLFFVDSDDWIEPEYCEKLYRSVQNTNAKVGICGVIVEEGKKTDFYRFDNTGVLSVTEALALLSVREASVYVPTVVAWNKIYHRSLWEKTRYPVGKWHEDEFVIAELLLNSQSVAVLTDCLYHYVKRPDSITGSDEAKNLKHLDILQAYFGRISLLQKTYPEFAVIAWRNYMLTIQEMLESGQFSADTCEHLKKQYRSAFRILRIPIRLKLKYRFYQIVPGVYRKIFSIRTI